MPILKSPSSDAPLTQGDVLTGLRLYTTAENWSDPGEPGGSAAWLKTTDLSLVLSRPCVSLHKSDFIAAAIGVVKEAVADEVNSFEKVKAFLCQLRDGYRRPDRFYLGQIANYPPGRYYALLDSLHTITKPKESELAVFLAQHRIATLTDEFRHDLALRIFSAFASLGFDDYGWYSDSDLQWVIEEGEKELAQKNVDCSSKKSELAKLNASGAAKGPKHTEGLENAVKNLGEEVSKLDRELRHFRDEMTRRSQSQSGSK